MQDSTLKDFHERYIRAVRPGALVIPEMFVVANLTNEVVDTLGVSTVRVHLRSIVLKHIYERRVSAYHYDFIIDHLTEIISFPHSIFKNRDSKLGDYIFARQFNAEWYACAVKLNAHPETGQEITVVVTAFRTSQRYLKKFELLRSWKVGAPSS